MKKQLSVWLALIFLISLCGCGKQDTQHLDMANYGDEFREKNDILFANTSCEHLVVYRDASAYLTPKEAKLYHMYVCKYGNCDHEIQFDPHVLVFYTKYPQSSHATYADNGYLYHQISAYCLSCTSIIPIKIFCEKQDANCGRTETGGVTTSECLAGDRDWKEVLNDLIKSEITSDAYYGSGRFPIAGTYQDNAYFSEYDIVVSLSDYHKLYASESITDAEHHFQRIGEIYPKPCE